MQQEKKRKKRQNKNTQSKFSYSRSTLQPTVIKRTLINPTLNPPPTQRCNRTMRHLPCGRPAPPPPSAPDPAIGQAGSSFDPATELYSGRILNCAFQKISTKKNNFPHTFNHAFILSFICLILFLQRHLVSLLPPRAGRSYISFLFPSSVISRPTTKARLSSRRRSAPALLYAFAFKAQKSFTSM